MSAWFLIPSCNPLRWLANQLRGSLPALFVSEIEENKFIYKMSKFIAHSKNKSWKDLPGLYSLMPDPYLVEVGCGYPSKTSVNVEYLLYA